MGSTDIFSWILDWLSAAEHSFIKIKNKLHIFIGGSKWSMQK